MATMSNRRERQLRTLGAAAGHRSIRSLAHAAGVARWSLKFVLDGTRKPRAKTIAKLAAALNVSADVIERVLAGAP